MATKVDLLNAALQELGHKRLSDTGEPVKAARDLLFVYDRVLAECLSSGSWNFAMETIKSDADTGVEPNFGYADVFAKPTDWVRTHGISEDEYFSRPLLHYYDDNNFWSADVTPIYVRYVSNDTGLGLELTRWTQAFTRYVELSLAERICMAVTQNQSLHDRILDMQKKAKRTALNQDAMNEPNPKFKPAGSWTTSRQSRNDRDRGSRSSLTG